MIHIFGDSYAAEHDGIDWQWYKQLSQRMQQPLQITSHFGVSNEWVCMQFMNYLKGGEIKKGDTVVVVTTNPDRHWFIWNAPQISNWNWISDDRKQLQERYDISDEQLQAIDLYYKHIKKDQLDFWKYDATQAWWNFYANMLNDQGISLVCIPGFAGHTDVHSGGPIPVTGSLMDAVCYPEFKSEAHMKKWYNRPYPDQRINHMLRDNHTVLATALDNSLTNRTSLDLMELPFKTGILSISSEAILKNQLSPTLMR